MWRAVAAAIRLHHDLPLCQDWRAPATVVTLGDGETTWLLRFQTGDLRGPA